MLATDNILEIADTIPCRMPAGCFTSTQVHRNARVRPFIGNGILTVAAVQGVRAVPAIQPVIVFSSLNDVACVITGQRILVRAADNVLNPPDTVPCCVPAGDFTSMQVHCDARVRPFIVRSCIRNGIVTVAAVQDVRADTAFQVVIAIAAFQPVITVTAIQPVIAGAARQLIPAAAAEQLVVTAVTVQPVIAVAAFQPVIAGVAKQLIIAVATEKLVITAAA